MVKEYNLKNIRAFLTEGFTNQELRHFCFDVSEFRPVFEQMSRNSVKTQIVQELLEYAERKELIEILLDELKERNTGKYEKYEPYYDTYGKSLRAKFLKATNAERMEELADMLGNIKGEKATINVLLYRLGDYPVQEDPDLEDAVCGALVKLGVMKRRGNQIFRFVSQATLAPGVCELIEYHRRFIPQKYFEGFDRICTK